MKVYGDENEDGPDLDGVVFYDEERRLLVDLGTGKVIAVILSGITPEEGEALAGALMSMRRTPDEWFVDFADALGEGEE